MEGWPPPPVAPLLLPPHDADPVARVQFMQRGLDAETKQQLEEDHKRIISDEHWYLDLPELKAKEWVPPPPETCWTTG